MRIPDSLDITTLTDGLPAAHMLVFLKFLASRKNPHNMLFGPSGPDGKISISRTQLLAEAKKTMDLFLMDYVGIEAAWTGTLVVTPLNREAISRARSAFQRFASYNYPANYKETLDAADAALAQAPSAKLSAIVQCSASEDIHIETVTVAAT